MESLIVIELEISIQALFQFHRHSIVLEINVFILDGPPQSFDEDVIKHTAPAVHADLHTSGFQAFCEIM